MVCRPKEIINSPIDSAATLDIGVFNLINMEVKICNKCNVEKSLELFYKHQYYKDGRNNSCKVCLSIMQKNRIKNNPENQKIKLQKSYIKRKEKIKIYLKENKERIKSVKKIYLEKNKEKYKEYHKLRYEKNKKIIIKPKIVNTYKVCNICNLKKKLELFPPDKKGKDKTRNECKICYSIKMKNYIKNKLLTDPIFKLNSRIRCLIGFSFKRASNNKFAKSKKTEEILGSSLDEFIIYIQSKFTIGMTLENHGEWHLDHIIPLATAKTEEDIIRLNHYTNFQPLWAKDNLSKSAKIINQQLTLI